MLYVTLNGREIAFFPDISWLNLSTIYTYTNALMCLINNASRKVKARTFATNVDPRSSGDEVIDWEKEKDLYVCCND